MKTVKLLFAVMLLAASLEFAATNSAQAKPTSAFQIAVRIGGGPRRPYYRRPYRRPYYHRPYYNRRPAFRGRPGWHRPYRRH